MLDHGQEGDQLDFGRPSHLMFEVTYLAPIPKFDVDLAG